MKKQAMKIINIIAIASSALLIAACSVPVYMGGHTDDYAEVIHGSAMVNPLAGTGTMSMTGERTGLECTGNFAPYVVAGDSRNHTRGPLLCNDGRTLMANMVQTNATGGTGTGSDEFGNSATFQWDMSQSLINSYLESYRQEVAALNKSIDHIMRKEPETAEAEVRKTVPQQDAVREAPVEEASSNFSTAPVSISFKKIAPRPDDIAVIIGNANYSRLSADMPDVVPAYADAESFKKYTVEALGIRPGNIIELKDATSAQLTRVFGTKENHKGQLYDWTRPGQSRVIIYYAGHGAPAGKDGSPYLVPVDADGTRIELNGYPLSTLYHNLSMLPATSVMVVLEACFSGASQSGSLISSASGIYVKPKAAEVPAEITVIAAGAADQMASWEKDNSHSLFTKYYLTGMAGEGDRAPYGNGDGHVDYEELDRYLSNTMTYYARRYYGRDQKVQIREGRGN